MGIIDRLGNVIRSYLNDADTAGDDPVFGRRERRGRQSSGDSDYDAAYEELNDFLNGKERPDTAEEANAKRYKERPEEKAVPEELRGDFAELGVPFGAPGDVCKEAYKKLLKIHHPDRHAGHPGNMKKATEKSARINAAYDRIEKWRKGEAL
jgi:DnaJ-domain-containing protein 1